MFLIYGDGELILEGYSDASFQSDDDDAKSQSDFVFKLNGGVVAWKSSKQDTTADSTMKAEYIAASEAAKEAVWMKNYIQELGVVPSIAEPVVIFCDNNGAIAQAKEPRSHHRSKHILRLYHLLREMVSRGDCRMDRVSSAENTADPLTKSMSQIAHTQVDGIGLHVI
ncbi:UNVERIFIED_CONTAM: Retrovirus-related Pol polyprotein from transposon TNT 1-94 [Sesamum radiatum]|uniref:Retrovirus-related Pol polyprotein from transposon TNT 1-94 n=1 Tax=Sesamum radiatum TaxID=300843 RepID=A0AAW2PHI4_SESRA